MKRSKGYAFIQFTSQDDAFLAIETMDRRVIEVSSHHKLKWIKLVNIFYVSKSTRMFTFLLQMYNGRMIYIDIAKPGKRDFQGLPRTSGPPEKPQVPEDAANDEVADCWY